MHALLTSSSIYDDRAQPLSEVIAPTQSVRNSDPSASQREYCKHDERYPHGGWRFTRYMPLVSMRRIVCCLRLGLLAVVSSETMRIVSRIRTVSLAETR